MIVVADGSQSQYRQTSKRISNGSNLLYRKKCNFGRAQFAVTRALFEYIDIKIGYFAIVNNIILFKANFNNICNILHAAFFPPRPPWNLSSPALYQMNLPMSFSNVEYDAREIAQDIDD